MTGKPTEKMVYALKKLGYQDAQIVLMDYNAASAIIGKSKESQFSKEVPSPQTDRVISQGFSRTQKPSYNPASQYVSYSKDIFLELRKMVHEEIMKPGSKLNSVTDEQIMARSVELVKIAIKAFE